MIHADRILTLADFIEKLPSGQFDMGRIWQGPINDRAGERQPPLGCAMGWSPAAFPIWITYVKEGLFELRGKPGLFNYYEVALHFFGIEQKEATLLFNTTYRANDVMGVGPDKAPIVIEKAIREVIPGVRRCRTSATPQQAAGMLRAYVFAKLKEEQP